MTDKKLIFIHLPKTAGTTIRSILNQQYGKDRICGIYDGDPGFLSHEAFDALPETEKEQYQVYCGHFPYGLHEKIKGKAHYYAMFRDPVERVISYYHHAMSHSPAFQKNPVSLMKFLDRKDWQVDNLYTRFISGQQAGYGMCHNRMVFKALENIDSHFLAVGLQKNFDISLKILGKRLGWSAPQHPPVNVGKERPSLEYFSVREINRIRELNQLDQVLFDYIQEKFARQRRELEDTHSSPRPEMA